MLPDPEDGFQVKNSVVGCPVDAFEGVERIGTEGGPGTVVKLQAEENKLAPPLFDALTRQ
jgi:hypothetical protein